MEGGWAEEADALWGCGVGEGARGCRGVGVGWGAAGGGQLIPVTIAVSVRCCFTSTENIRTIRDGKPSTFTSTFAQLLRSVGSSSSVLLSVHRGYEVY